MMINVEYKVQKIKGSKQEFKAFKGKPTVTTKAPDWKEKVWNPSAGSWAASIFSFGIAAAAGCNFSTVKHKGKTSYSVETQTYSYTFPQEGQSFGIKLGKVLGNGSILDGPNVNGKTVSFTIQTNGPD